MKLRINNCFKGLGSKWFNLRLLTATSSIWHFITLIARSLHNHHNQLPCIWSNFLVGKNKHYFSTSYKELESYHCNISFPHHTLFSTKKKERCFIHKEQKISLWISEPRSPETVCSHWTASLDYRRAACFSYSFI